jgi:hypothetical protein
VKRTPIVEEKLSVPAQPYLTIGQAAQRLGCQTWQVRELYKRKKLPPAARLGVYRIIHEDELPTIAAALSKAGYVRVEKVHDRREGVATRHMQETEPEQAPA